MAALTRPPGVVRPGWPAIVVAAVACLASGPAGLARRIQAASVRPTAAAGQDGSGPGVPRYTVRVSSRGQAPGCRDRFSTFQPGGTRRLTRPKVTVRHRMEAAVCASAGGPTTKELTTIARTKVVLRNPIQPSSRTRRLHVVTFSQQFGVGRRLCVNNPYGGSSSGPGW